MKEIKLSKGQVALVDDWRYEELNEYEWQALFSKHTQSYYATRSQMVCGKREFFYMHRVVAGTPKGMKTDHVNRKTLDNQEHNLRVCTNSQNMMNSGLRIDNTSGYKGVCKHREKWQAKIKVNKKYESLGVFSTPEEAAHAYDEGAKKYYGEFAVLNFQ